MKLASNVRERVREIEDLAQNASRIRIPRSNAELRRDPTRTTTIRRKYSAEMYKRFRLLKGLVREAVAKQDVLAIRSGPRSNVATNQRIPPRFDFATDPDKIDGFMAWLQEMTEQDILEVSVGASRSRISRSHWQNLYVRSAYSRGITLADTNLKAAGFDIGDTEALEQTFAKPVHAEKLAVLFGRNFRELQGITQAMGQDISRVLTEGLARGWNPNKMATRINRRIDKIGLTRARRLARTETIRAHSTSTLARYREHGLTEVVGKAEFATAGDSRVCPICNSLEGRRFTIEDAEGIIPVHPNCRCAWLPVTEKSTREGQPRFQLPTSTDVVDEAKQEGLPIHTVMPDEENANAVFQALEETSDTAALPEDDWMGKYKEALGLPDEGNHFAVTDIRRMTFDEVEDTNWRGFRSWDGEIALHPKVTDDVFEFVEKWQEGGTIEALGDVPSGTLDSVRTVIHEFNHARSGINAQAKPWKEYQKLGGRFLEEGAVEWKARNTIRHMKNRIFADFADDGIETVAKGLQGAYPKETGAIDLARQFSGNDNIADDIFKATTTQERKEIFGDAIKGHVEDEVLSYLELADPDLHDRVADGLRRLIQEADNARVGEQVIEKWGINGVNILSGQDPDIYSDVEIVLGFLGQLGIDGGELGDLLFGT